MPRGRKPKKVIAQQQQEQQPVKTIEIVDTSNREAFISLLDKRGVTASNMNGVVYATVEPEKIKDTLIIMNECQIKSDYRGSFGAGVGQKK